MKAKFKWPLKASSFRDLLLELYLKLCIFICAKYVYAFVSSTCQSSWRFFGTWTSSMPKCTSSWTGLPESWNAPTTRWWWTASPRSKRSRGERDWELSFFHVFGLISFIYKSLPSLMQVNGDYWDFAEPGGVSVRAGGATSLHGATAGQEGEERATQDHPLIPLPEGALHSTQVPVLSSIEEESSYLKSHLNTACQHQMAKCWSHLLFCQVWGWVCSGQGWKFYYGSQASAIWRREPAPEGSGVGSESCCPGREESQGRGGEGVQPPDIGVLPAADTGAGGVQK